jgi:hypothetical protein
MSENKTLSLRASKAPDGKARIVAVLGDRELMADTCDLWSDADRDRLADAIHRVCPAIKLKEIQRRLLLIDRENLPVGENASSKQTETIWEPSLIRFDTIDPRPVRWLWRDRLAQGRISLLVGVPGCGKSFVSCDLAARISTGSQWPDGSPIERGEVIFITAEDDPHDTIRPRLDVHGADVSKVHLLQGVHRVDPTGERKEQMFSLADVVILEKAMAQVKNCRLIVIDPIGSFLGGRTDSNRDNEVRSVLAPVSKIAEVSGAAILIVAHRRKGSSGSADETTLGSRAFTGLARAVWHLSKDPDDPKRRLFLPGKNNLSGISSGLAFSIEGDPAAVRWEPDPLLMDADDAMAAERESSDRGDRSAIGEAILWLKEELSGGAVPTKSIKERAKQDGIAERTLERAASKLSILREREGFTGPYKWRLPSEKE